MAHDGHAAHLFQWKAFGNKKAKKTHSKNYDIDQWRKRVEEASEFAVSEVFSRKKLHLDSPHPVMPLQSSAQLKDHDDAHSEAQALLGDWLHSKLWLELEMDEEDGLIRPAEKSSPHALAPSRPTPPKYNSFDDMFNSLTKDEENSSINNFLQDLKEQEILDSAMMDQLAMDIGQTRKKFRNPALTMEARHKQVRENKALREAEIQMKRRDQAAAREAREQARGRERELKQRRVVEARRQEEMLQQEVFRLRRQMEEKRCAQQLARQREREQVQIAAVQSPQRDPANPTTPQKQDKQQIVKEQQVETLLYMHNIKFLQRHFAGWLSVVLNQRIRLDKAKTVNEWRRKLRAWRAWRTLVWQKQQQREVERTELELQAENRCYLLAVHHDKRRMLRRCMNRWLVWSQTEKAQRNLLSQQQETRRKMDALISAASRAKLRATQNPTCSAALALTETASKSQTVNTESGHGAVTAASPVRQEENPGANMAPLTQPTEPWQINRQHVAPTGAEVRRALLKESSLKHVVTPGARFEHRHNTQQQIISQQRKLLKEQQEQIAQLRQEQHFMGLELEVQKTAQLIQMGSVSGTKPKIHKSEPSEHREKEESGQPPSPCGQQKQNTSQQTCPHPIIAAMEARARLRAERKRKVEVVKKRKEEEKLAEMKAAEEQRQREEEEERRRAAERRREKSRLEREREEERQRRLRRQQEQMTRARQHYHRTLLLRRGIAPWKRLVQLTQANAQLARSHHSLSLLRLCTLRWHQSARESLSEKEASADRLHQLFLLRRSLGSWKRLNDWRMIQEERAERFCRARALRRVLLALQDFVTQKRLLDRDVLVLVEEHNRRRVLRRWFLAWRQLPFLLQREREKEQRREKLFQKVAEVLPDFSLHL